jgi:subtilisin family serine protease
MTGGIYRGTPWTGQYPVVEYGMGQGPYFPARVSAADVALEEMIAAGVHICIAAGNNGMKIDIESGLDWNNTWTDGNYSYYYQQGGSPYSQNANIIGSIDYHPLDPTRDTRAIYSEVGPGVMIYSPGTGIFSACSNINTLALEGYSAVAYHLDSRYKQANLSGTSMASPNACGLGALALQLNPGFTPATLQEWFLTNGKRTLYSTGLDNDYGNIYSVVGGDNLLIYNPYAADKSVNVAGTVSISGDVSIKITR